MDEKYSDKFCYNNICIYNSEGKCTAAKLVVDNFGNCLTKAYYDIYGNEKNDK